MFDEIKGNRTVVLLLVEAWNINDFGVQRYKVLSCFHNIFSLMTKVDLNHLAVDV